MATLETATPDRLAQFVASFTGSRAEQVHAALGQVQGLLAEYRIVLAELAWEVHTEEHWRQISRPGGGAYPDAQAYFQDVLAFRTKSQTERYLRVGRLLHRRPEAERAPLRVDLADIGIAKADLIACLAGHRASFGDVQAWIDRAKGTATSEREFRTAIREVEFPAGRTGKGSSTIKWSGPRRFQAHLSALGVGPLLCERFLTAAAARFGVADPALVMTTVLEQTLARWQQETP